MSRKFTVLEKIHNAAKVLQTKSNYAAIFFRLRPDGIAQWLVTDGYIAVTGLCNDASAYNGAIDWPETFTAIPYNSSIERITFKSDCIKVAFPGVGEASASYAKPASIRLDPSNAFRVIQPVTDAWVPLLGSTPNIFRSAMI